MLVGVVGVVFLRGVGRGACDGGVGVDVKCLSASMLVP